jgi:RNA-directed DNA polymerase
MVMKDMIFTNKASQIASLKEKWATLNSKEMEKQWNQICWKPIEKRVNKLQSRITKAIIEGKKSLAKKLQYLLTNSFYAKLLAVRILSCQRKAKKEKEIQYCRQCNNWLMNCLSGMW